MQQIKQTLLCVDDDQDNCELLAFLFERNGFEVTACGSTEECLSLIREKKFSAIVLDNRLGGSTSVEICREIRFSSPLTPIIFYSGEARPAEIEKALAAGGNVYLVKPNDFDKLMPTVSRLISEKSERV